MSVTLEQALLELEAMRCKLADIGWPIYPSHCDAIFNYLKQPTDNPDAEVWAEIDNLLNHVDARENATDHFAFTSDGVLWGVARVPPSTWIHMNRLQSLRPLSEIHDDLKTTMEPTLESETAARKEAEKTLDQLQAAIQAKNEDYATLREEQQDALRRAKVEIATSAATFQELQTTRETLAACEARVAELEMPLPRRIYDSLLSDGIYKVGHAQPDGTFRILHAVPGSASWMHKNNAPVLSESYATRHDAQKALDAYCKEHNWPEVVPCV